MRDSRRADAGLVGEGGAGDTDNRYAQNTAFYRLAGKGLAKDEHEHRGHVANIAQDNEEGAEHIENAHGRNEARGYAGDALDAADDDCADHCGENQPEEPIIGFEDGADYAERFYGLIRLKHIATAERTADTEHGEEHGEGAAEFFEPPEFKPFFKVVHGAAGDAPIALYRAIHNRQGTGGQF